MQQRDRVERAVPEPLERISRRRGAHEVVSLSCPRRDPALAVALEYSTRIGGDLAPICTHDRGLSSERSYRTPIPSFVPAIGLSSSSCTGLPSGAYGSRDAHPLARQGLSITAD